MLSAGVWSLGGSGLSLVLRLGSNLLMTRLLVPEMFGVVAIATTIMIGLALFSDFGVRLTVIQSVRGDEPAFLNTAWTAQIIRGLLIWIVALLLSFVLWITVALGAISPTNAYAAPYLPFVIAIVSFGAVISGFESTKVLQANRNLSLGAITAMELISQSCGVASMVVWAIFDRSIWALVTSSIVSPLVRTLLSHVWLRGISNRPFWDSAAANELAHFGKWLFVSSILGFAVNNGDRLFLASLLSPTVLGIYVIASTIYGVIEQLLGKLMGDVSFPAFSEVARNRPTQMRSTYYRFFAVLGSASYFSSGALIVCGDAIIRLLYDSRYEQAGWMLQVLGVSILTLPFRLVTQALLALGKPHMLTQIISLRLIAMVCLIFVGNVFFGIAGAIWGVVLSQFVYLPLILIYGVRFELIDWKKELSVLPMVLAGLLVGRIVVAMIGY